MLMFKHNFATLTCVSKAVQIITTTLCIHMEEKLAQNRKKNIYFLKFSCKFLALTINYHQITTQNELSCFCQ